MLKKMRRVAQFAGLDVRRFRDPWAALDRLPEVRTLVDVGVGDNGTPWLWKRFSGAKLLLVDPLRECRPDPMPPNASFVEAALGAEERNATINIAPRVSQSSLLERTALTHKGAPVEKREVRMRRLDDVVEGEPPFGLKIDTEGYELEVLKGGEDTLAMTRFLIMEVRFRKSFEGSYSFAEVIGFLSERGFAVSAILNPNDRMCDMIFERLSFEGP